MPSLAKTVLCISHCFAPLILKTPGGVTPVNMKTWAIVFGMTGAIHDNWGEKGSKEGEVQASGQISPSQLQGSLNH
jgi:hypothetical protein